MSFGCTAAQYDEHTYFSYLGVGANQFERVTRAGRINLTKHGSAKYVFVSSTNGSVSYNGLSPTPGFDFPSGTPNASAGPKATMAQGYVLLTVLVGDWMLMESGTNYAANFDEWSRGGLSAAYPMLFSTYDSADPTNVSKFRTGRWTMGGTNYFLMAGAYAAQVTSTRKPLNYVVIENLDFARSAAASVQSINFIGEGTGVLLENTNVSLGVIDFQGTTNGTTEYYLTNACARLVTSYQSCYSTGSNGGGIHSQLATGLTIECSLIDKSGWTAATRTTNPGDIDLEPSVFHHGLYMGAMSENTVVRRNIIARPSSHGLQARGGSTAYKNVFIECPYPFFLGGCDMNIVAWTDAIADGYSNLICGQQSIRGFTSDITNGGTAMIFLNTSDIPNQAIRGNIAVGTPDGYIGGADRPFESQCDVSSGSTDLITEVPIVANGNHGVFAGNIVTSWGSIAYATNGKTGSDAAGTSVTRENNIQSNEAASGTNIAFSTVSGSMVAPTRDVDAYATYAGYANTYAMLDTLRAAPYVTMADEIRSWVAKGYNR